LTVPTGSQVPLAAPAQPFGVNRISTIEVLGPRREATTSGNRGSSQPERKRHKRPFSDVPALQAPPGLVDGWLRPRIQNATWYFPSEDTTCAGAAGLIYLVQNPALHPSGLGRSGVTMHKRKLWFSPNTADASPAIPGGTYRRYRNDSAGSGACMSVTVSDNSVFADVVTSPGIVRPGPYLVIR
jgi:hypothetical protein